MKPHNSFLVLILLLSTTCIAPVAAESNTPPSYEEARQASWIFTTTLIEALEEGDAKQWPGTQAWLKDFREQTKGISKDTPIAKWPKVDIGVLVDHNPNFWRMYFEIAPGDPTFTLIHAGLLLSQGEAKRAAYILELGQHRPGIPKETMQGLRMLQNTAIAALKASDSVTEQGTKLFDQGNYDAALKKYREAQTLCPTNGWTYYEIGYTLRTKAQVARGEAPDKPGTVKVNVGSQDTPDVIAAFAETQRHDPLGFMAYQGTNPELIKGGMVIVKQVMPAWKALREEGIEKGAEYHALQDISEGLGEAGVHDLAIFARQLMAARRNSYDPSDYPILAAGLRKLAPGAAIEEILARLAGKNGNETLKFRPLTKQENEDGQPGLGSGERLYVPDKPPPKTDANKPVRLDFLRLLTPEDDLTKRTTVEDLTKFSKTSLKIAEEVLGKCETPCKVLVHFTCAPSGHTVEIMHQPKDIDEKPLQELHEALAKLEKLSVKEKTVEFEIQLSITPKNKLPVPPPAPAPESMFKLQTAQLIREKSDQDSYMVVFSVEAQKPEQFEKPGLNFVFVFFDDEIKSPPVDLKMVEGTSAVYFGKDKKTQDLYWKVHSAQQGITGTAHAVGFVPQHKTVGNHAVARWGVQAPPDKDIGLYLFDDINTSASNVLVFRKKDFVEGNSDEVFKAAMAKLSDGDQTGKQNEKTDSLFDQK